MSVDNPSDVDGFEQEAVDCVVLRGAAQLQCLGCGTVFVVEYKRPDGDVDEDELPEAEGRCPLCSQRRGRPVIAECAFVAGSQLADLTDEDAELEAAIGDTSDPSLLEASAEGGEPALAPLVVGTDE